MSGKERNQKRVEILKILSHLDQRWVEAASSSVSQRLQKLFTDTGFGTVKNILVPRNLYPGDVNLSQFLAGQRGIRRIFMPRITGESQIQFVELTEAGDGSSLELGATAELLDPKECAMIVPGLYFDSEGDRLSRGQGRYSKLLITDFAKECLRIGVCWSLQLCDRIPGKTTEAPMQWIVHEEGTVRCVNK